MKSEKTIAILYSDILEDLYLQYDNMDIALLKYLNLFNYEIIKKEEARNGEQI